MCARVWLCPCVCVCATVSFCLCACCQCAYGQFWCVFCALGVSVCACVRARALTALGVLARLSVWLLEFVHVSVLSPCLCDGLYPLICLSTPCAPLSPKILSLDSPVDDLLAKNVGEFVTVCSSYISQAECCRQPASPNGCLCIRSQDLAVFGQFQDGWDNTAHGRSLPTHDLVVGHK